MSAMASLSETGSMIHDKSDDSDDDSHAHDHDHTARAHKQSNRASFNLKSHSTKRDTIRRSKLLAQVQHLTHSLLAMKNRTVELEHLLVEQHKQFSQWKSAQSTSQQHAPVQAHVHPSQSSHQITTAEMHASPSTSQQTHTTNTAQKRVHVANVPTANNYDLIEPAELDDMDTVINTHATLTKRPATAPSSPVAKKAKSSATKNIPTTAAPQQQQAVKSAKPPPIVVTNLDCKRAAQVLSTTIGTDAFSFRRIGPNTTHINTKSPADFKSVRSILEKSNAAHHTFTPKAEQINNIVLRHLDSSYDENDIADAIARLQLDITIEKVMMLPTQSKLQAQIPLREMPS